MFASSRSSLRSRLALVSGLALAATLLSPVWTGGAPATAPGVGSLAGVEHSPPTSHSTPPPPAGVPSTPPPARSIYPQRGSAPAADVGSLLAELLRPSTGYAL